MAGELHCRQLTHFHVHTKELPHYRFVDVYVTGHIIALCRLR
jgi:hypothetical protein